jgi:hypothetical protein
MRLRCERDIHRDPTVRKCKELDAKVGFHTVKRRSTFERFMKTLALHLERLKLDGAKKWALMPNAGAGVVTTYGRVEPIAVPIVGGTRKLASANPQA